MFLTQYLHSAGGVMFSDFITTENLLFITTGLAITIMMFVADRLARRAIKRYSKQLKLQPHVQNIFKLTTRIVIFAVGIVAFYPISICLPNGSLEFLL